MSRLARVVDRGAASLVVVALVVAVVPVEADHGAGGCSLNPLETLPVLSEDPDHDGQATCDEWIYGSSNHNAASSTFWGDDDLDGQANNLEGDCLGLGAEGTSPHGLACSGAYGVVLGPNTGYESCTPIGDVWPCVEQTTVYAWWPFCIGLGTSNLAKPCDHFNPATLKKNANTPPYPTDGFSAAGWYRVGTASTLLPVTTPALVRPCDLDDPVVDADGDGLPGVVFCTATLTVYPDGSTQWGPTAPMGVTAPDVADDDPDSPVNHTLIGELAGEAVGTVVNNTGVIQDLAMIALGIVQNITADAMQEINETLEALDTDPEALVNTTEAVAAVLVQAIEDITADVTALAEAVQQLPACVDAATAAWQAYVQAELDDFTGGPSDETRDAFLAAVVVGAGVWQNDVNSCVVSLGLPGLPQEVVGTVVAAAVQVVESYRSFAVNATTTVVGAVFGIGNGTTTIIEDVGNATLDILVRTFDILVDDVEQGTQIVLLVLGAFAEDPARIVPDPGGPSEEAVNTSTTSGPASEEGARAGFDLTFLAMVAIIAVLVGVVVRR